MSKLRCVVEKPAGSGDVVANAKLVVGKEKTWWKKLGEEIDVIRIPALWFLYLLCVVVSCFDSFNFMIPPIFKFGCIVSLVVRGPWAMTDEWFYHTDLCTFVCILGFLLLWYPDISSPTINALFYTGSTYAAFTTIVLNLKFAPTRLSIMGAFVFHHQNILLTYYFIKTREGYLSMGLLRNFVLTNCFGFTFFVLQMVVEDWLRPSQSCFVVFYPELKESLKDVGFYPALIRVLERTVPSYLDPILFTISIYLVFFISTLLATLLMASNTKCLLVWYWFVWLNGVRSAVKWYREVDYGWYHA